MTPATSVSIIVPAYNEAARLQDAVDALQGWAADTPHETEIIIVEDGSTDGTDAVAAEIAANNDAVTHLHRERRQGKGAAIRQGFAAARHENLCFLDADLAVGPAQLEAVLQPVVEGEADAAVGSRYLPGSDTDRSRRRDVLSRGYNLLARTVLRTGIHDHQCGCKAVSRHAYDAVADDITAEGWLWDTELVHRLQRHGFSVEEVPVRWTAGEGSSVGAAEAAAELSIGLMRLKGEAVLGRRWRTTSQFLRFAVIGGFGAALNTAVLYVLTTFLDIYYIASAVIAVETAIIAMFFLNNRYTFIATKRGRQDILDGIVRSNLVRSVGIAVNVGLLYTLTEWAGIYYLASNLLAIAAASVCNFAGEKTFNWER